MCLVRDLMGTLGGFRGCWRGFGCRGGDPCVDSIRRDPNA